MTVPESSVLSETAEPKLTDVMLAMDVVDSLRHEESLVARALNEEARTKLMVERVRAAYAGQGIEVSDATIEAGVIALKERQYVYEPPAPGLRTRFYSAWTRRGRIGRGFGLFAGVVALIGAGYVGFVQYPRAQQLVADVDSLNASISVASVDLKTLEQRRVMLNAALDRSASDVPTGIRDGFEAEVARARQSSVLAARKLVEASTLTQAASYTSDNYSRLAQPANRQLNSQQALLVDATTALDSLEGSLGRLERLKGLPDELSLLHTEALAAALEPAVDAQIDSIYRAALSKLRQGDAVGASEEADRLKSMILDLDLAYTLSIVSRPGERSGVIRAPESNDEANNYYLIVEALDNNGKALRLPVRSEEDGAVRQLTAWGLRVDRRTYERVGADKQSDGIVDNRVAGTKRRGYLNVDYAISTTGNTLTEWRD